MITNKNPAHQDIQKYGNLAYVSKEKAKEVMNNPAAGQVKPFMDALDREVKNLKKKQNKRAGW